MRRTDGIAICYFKKDLSPGKAIHVERNGQVTANEYPRMDPMAEYVAWSRSTGGDNFAVALKGVNDDPTRPASLLLPEGYRAAYFCDWTEQNTLLVNATDNGRDWCLLTIDKDGKLLRRMETPVRPSKGVIASWRKYGHR
jgi:hypothetical protein